MCIYTKEYKMWIKPIKIRKKTKTLRVGVKWVGRAKQKITWQESRKETAEKVVRGSTEVREQSRRVGRQCSKMCYPNA